MSKPKTSWTFYECWNATLEKREERKIEPRDRIWASELGGSMVDRYLKMTGVKPTNPPNPRSLRKFEAGNIWEWIVGLVLRRAGILLDSQGWVQYQYPGLLPVTGKLDYLAGGRPDWDKAKEDIQKFGFPDFITRVGGAIVDYLANKYTFGLDEIVLEVKSCSSFMFERYEATGKANPNHVLQTYHYLKAKNLPEGHIVYISKDDVRMLEIAVFNPSSIEEIYKRDIQMMTDAVNSKQQPVLEKEVEFNEVTCRFSHNWKVMYSQYLTMLYGYKDQNEFEDKYRPLVAKWNRVLGRCVEDKNMTQLNLDVIEGIQKVFPNFNELVKKGKEVKKND